MTNKFKHIHIGEKIKEIVDINGLSISRACKYLKCTVRDIEGMYKQESLDTVILLKWCKLLNYNFFMYYHTHLQLYKASASRTAITDKDYKVKQELTFKKNLYSPEIIDWLVNQVKSNKVKPNEIVEKYKIPKTTLYRWLRKYEGTKKENKRKKKKAQIDYKRIYLDYVGKKLNYLNL